MVGVYKRMRDSDKGDVNEVCLKREYGCRRSNDFRFNKDNGKSYLGKVVMDESNRRASHMLSDDTEIPSKDVRYIQG